jgi:hypothetical protein
MANQHDPDLYTQISTENARARHPDWDQAVTNHAWTAAQIEEVNAHQGDQAEFIYRLAKENAWKPVPDEEIFGDDGGRGGPGGAKASNADETEAESVDMSDEAIYGD